MGAKVKVKNLLYAIFSIIVQRLSVKHGWYIETTPSINPINFQVRTPNVTVRQNRKRGQFKNQQMTRYTVNNSSIHLQRDNKAGHGQSISMDVSTKNSVDEPSNVTI